MSQLPSPDRLAEFNAEAGQAERRLWLAALRLYILDAAAPYNDEAEALRDIERPDCPILHRLCQRLDLEAEWVRGVVLPKLERGEIGAGRSRRKRQAA